MQTKDIHQVLLEMYNLKPFIDHISKVFSQTQITQNLAPSLTNKFVFRYPYMINDKLGLLLIVDMVNNKNYFYPLVNSSSDIPSILSDFLGLEGLAEKIEILLFNREILKITVVNSSIVPLPNTTGEKINLRIWGVHIPEELKKYENLLGTETVIKVCKDCEVEKYNISGKGIFLHTVETQHNLKIPIISLEEKLPKELPVKFYGLYLYERYTRHIMYSTIDPKVNEILFLLERKLLMEFFDSFRKLIIEKIEDTEFLKDIIFMLDSLIVEEHLFTSLLAGMLEYILYFSEKEEEFIKHFENIFSPLAHSMSNIEEEPAERFYQLLNEAKTGKKFLNETYNSSKKFISYINIDPSSFELVEKLELIPNTTPLKYYVDTKSKTIKVFTPDTYYIGELPKNVSSILIEDFLNGNGFIIKKYSFETRLLSIMSKFYVEIERDVGEDVIKKFFFEPSTLLQNIETAEREERFIKALRITLRIMKEFSEILEKIPILDSDFLKSILLEISMVTKVPKHYLFYTSNYIEYIFSLPKLFNFRSLESLQDYLLNNTKTIYTILEDSDYLNEKYIRTIKKGEELKIINVDYRMTVLRKDGVKLGYLRFPLNKIITPNTKIYFNDSEYLFDLSKLYIAVKIER